MLIDINLPFEWCKDCPALDIKTEPDGGLHYCTLSELCRQVYNAAVNKKVKEANK